MPLETPTTTASNSRASPSVKSHRISRNVSMLTWRRTPGVAFRNSQMPFSPVHITLTQPWKPACTPHDTHSTAVNSSAKPRLQPARQYLGTSYRKSRTTAVEKLYTDLASDGSD